MSPGSNISIGRSVYARMCVFLLRFAVAVLFNFLLQQHSIRTVACHAVVGMMVQRVLESVDNVLPIRPA